ncbi:hypothetical protein XNC1_0416 [Xenorhabdus nematophila ATCC 19061]|uniref:Uncharacterized protein n=1 Tax=Xenorhabdus nematophila (strain ATCC 19061 / DSM 3370 / CCUG 14189 / LMG 1036 / NCIMB 9965 / AN6) TaxID=406817 RepID=D3VI04_XENNA|nr:hypothetical protein XNC1_0416 [Xenorhabdus nematophila ATCC 19061]
MTEINWDNQQSYGLKSMQSVDFYSQFFRLK